MKTEPSESQMETMKNLETNLNQMLIFSPCMKNEKQLKFLNNQNFTAWIAPFVVSSHSVSMIFASGSGMTDMCLRCQISSSNLSEVFNPQIWIVVAAVAIAIVLFGGKVTRVKRKLMAGALLTLPSLLRAFLVRKNFYYLT